MNKKKCTLVLAILFLTMPLTANNSAAPLKQSYYNSFKSGFIASTGAVLLLCGIVNFTKAMSGQTCFIDTTGNRYHALPMPELVTEAMQKTYSLVPYIDSVCYAKWAAAQLLAGSILAYVGFKQGLEDDSNFSKEVTEESTAAI